MKKLLFTSLLLGLFVGAFGKGFEEFDFPRLDFACDEDFFVFDWYDEDLYQQINCDLIGSFFENKNIGDSKKVIELAADLAVFATGLGATFSEDTNSYYTIYFSFPFNRYSYLSTRKFSLPESSYFENNESIPAKID